MITGWEIYWIMQLDAIHETLTIFTAVSAAVCILATVFHFITASDAVDDDDRKLSRKLGKASIWSGILFLLFVIPLTFLPTTKAAAAVVVLPRVLNNENLQDEAKELYTIAKEGMKKLCEEEDKK